MAFTTLFIVIPLAYIASIFWTQFIISKFKSVITIDRFYKNVLLEIIKLIILLIITILLTIIGMILLLGIIGIPLLMILILSGISLNIYDFTKKNIIYNIKLFATVIFNIFSYLLIPLLLVIVVNILSVEKSMIEYNADNADNADNVDNVDNVDIGDNNFLSSTMKIIPSQYSETSYKFPFTIHQKFSNPYKLRIVFNFKNQSIKKLVINQCKINIDGIDYDLLDSEDVHIWHRIKGSDGSSISSKNLSKSDYTYFFKTKELSVEKNLNGSTEYSYLYFNNLPLDSIENSNIQVNIKVQMHMADETFFTLIKKMSFTKSSKIKKGPIKMILSNKY